MGVRGLQTFIENFCQSACIEVSIIQLVINYRRETGNQFPVIVVDGSSCLNPLYGNLEWITGGQMKQYAENLTFFVSQFQKIGVKLVFFFDGPTENRKRATWVNRRMNTMNNVYKILDMLANGKNTTDIDRNLIVLPAGISFITTQMLLLEFGCEVHTSIVECDEEIADYARKNQCFAILGQDSDYIIYEGNHYYLSMAHLNLKTMKTMLYDRHKLAQTLNISVQDLPLLATLIGNDVISVEELKPFHRDLVRRYRGNHVRPNFQVLFPCVADYIRHLVRNNDLQSSLPGTAQYVLGDRSKADLILTSLRSYSSAAFQGSMRSIENSVGWEKILEEAKFRHMTTYFPPMIYSVMIGLPYEASTLIEDFRRNDLIFSSSVMKPLRQRIYGILLHEKPPGSSPHLVREFCMEGPRSLDQENKITPVPPRAHHPGLLSLWISTNESDIQEKWDLFISSISLKLEKEKIKCLPEHLIFPALILCYFTEEKVLHDWEIDAILAMAVVLKQYNTKRISELPTDPVSLRAVRIVPLIMRSAIAIYFLSAACGYPFNKKLSSPCTYFDGKLFQLKYHAMEKKVSLLELCDNSVSCMEDFQKVKSVISTVN